MPDTIGTAQYYKIERPDKPGECACLLGTLREAGVDLLAFSGFPRGRAAQLDVVPSDLARFKAAARKAKWKLKGPKTCFVVEGEDRPGAVADLVAPLACRQDQYHGPYGHLCRSRTLWSTVLGEVARHEESRQGAWRGLTRQIPRVSAL